MFIAFLVAAAATVEPITSLGSSKDESTSARLVETDGSVRFEITGPEYIVPSIAIDTNRNGKIDPDVDFMIGFGPGGSPCRTRLLAEGRTSTCLPLDGKAQVTKQQQGGDKITTVITFRKNVISTDGFGFGFALTLQNTKEHYGVDLASGDYRWGGFLQLVSDSVNFMGEGTPVPSQITPAIHLYEGCLHRETSVLLPLVRSKLEKLKAVPNLALKIVKPPPMRR